MRSGKLGDAEEITQLHGEDSQPVTIITSSNVINSNKDLEEGDGITKSKLAEVHNALKKGDKVIHSEPISPIPNGKYRIKGTLGKLRITDLHIV